MIMHPMKTALTVLSLICFLPPLTCSAISINAIQSLAFGKFAAGTGGTVRVSSSNVRTKTGAVTLLSSDKGHAALFSVTSPSTGTYSISLPTSVTLSSGSHTVTVDGFESNPAHTGADSPAASSLSVGATMTISSNQTPGDYSGTFMVTINQN